jgi:hypothetical protein
MGIFKKRRVTDGRMTFTPCPVKTKEQIEEDKWEARRWRLVCALVTQDRRSVVLGKLNASPSAIAKKARQLTDATINELRNNKLDSYGDE